MVDAGGFSRSNGVVSDNATNLEWQDDYSDNGGTIKESSWSNAISYCETLTLDGKNDWRLPNLNELTSLVDYTKFNPSIDVIFQNTNSSYYWSSTSRSNVNGDAWVVYFNNGNQTYYNKDSSYYVRCVRAGQ
jgi:predicted phosphohydrolase